MPVRLRTVVVPRFVGVKALSVFVEGREEKFLHWSDYVCWQWEKMVGCVFFFDWISVQVEC